MPKAKTQAGAAITHSGSRLDYDAVAAQCPAYVEAVWVLQPYLWALGTYSN